MERVESENCEQRVRRSSSELSRTEGRHCFFKKSAAGDFYIRCSGDCYCCGETRSVAFGGVLTGTTITRVVGCIVGLVGGILITLLRCLDNTRLYIYIERVLLEFSLGKLACEVFQCNH